MDIGRMENMKYDEEKDCYYCKNSQVLLPQYEKKVKTRSGYQRTVAVYQSNGCFQKMKEKPFSQTVY